MIEVWKILINTKNIKISLLVYTILYVNAKKSIHIYMMVILDNTVYFKIYN